MPQSHESLLLSSFYRWVNWGRGPEICPAGGVTGIRLQNTWSWSLSPSSRGKETWRRFFTRSTSVADKLQRAFTSVTSSKSHKTARWAGQILSPNSNWENWGWAGSGPRSSCYWVIWGQPSFLVKPQFSEFFFLIHFLRQYVAS